MEKQEEGEHMRLDGFGIFVKDMGTMIRFYRDVLGFGIKENEESENVFLEKDGTLFLLYGRGNAQRADRLQVDRRPDRKSGSCR